MIRLKVENYCKNCTEFEPETERNFIDANGEHLNFNTTITCKHEKRCHEMMDYLRDEAEYERKSNSR